VLLEHCNLSAATSSRGDVMGRRRGAAPRPGRAHAVRALDLNLVENAGCDLRTPQLLSVSGRARGLWRAGLGPCPADGFLCAQWARGAIRCRTRWGCHVALPIAALHSIDSREGHAWQKVEGQVSTD
jgi:hypothetical protein